MLPSFCSSCSAPSNLTLCLNLSLSFSYTHARACAHTHTQPDLRLLHNIAPVGKWAERLLLELLGCRSLYLSLSACPALHVTMAIIKSNKILAWRIGLGFRFSWSPQRSPGWIKPGAVAVVGLALQVLPPGDSEKPPSLESSLPAIQTMWGWDHQIPRWDQTPLFTIVSMHAYLKKYLGSAGAPLLVYGSLQISSFADIWCWSYREQFPHNPRCAFF